ncbi:hypothetical protein BBJ28_00017972, partial [Nothophytophthora sp. Chile5]
MQGNLSLSNSEDQPPPPRLSDWETNPLFTRNSRTRTDLDDTQRVLRSPLMGGEATTINTRSVVSCVNSRLSALQYLNSPAERTQDMPLAAALAKKRSFHHHTDATDLRGKISRAPRRWLWVRFLNNSFFARRLMSSGVLLIVALASGLSFYSTYIAPWLERLKTSEPEKYEYCQVMVEFSVSIYETLPVAIVLVLPGSGWRVFEPFKREDATAVAASSNGPVPHNNTVPGDEIADPELEQGEPSSGSLTQIRRGFVFQLCEVLAVLLVALNARLIMYFFLVLLSGAIFRCVNFSVQIFALGGAGCYAGLFVVLHYFARYREHIKMQLGAFHESDQTGDVRNRVGGLGMDHTLNQTHKMLTNVRKRLYRATRRGDLHEMREILDYAQDRGLTSQEFGFPRKSYAAPTISLGFFAKSCKNPVHVAAYHGNIRALELLEARGFDLTALDKVSRVRFSTGNFFWYFVR